MPSNTVHMGSLMVIIKNKNCRIAFIQVLDIYPYLEEILFVSIIYLPGVNKW